MKREVCGIANDDKMKIWNVAWTSANRRWTQATAQLARTGRDRGKSGKERAQLVRAAVHRGAHTRARARPRQRCSVRSPTAVRKNVSCRNSDAVMPPPPITSRRRDDHRRAAGSSFVCRGMPPPPHILLHCCVSHTHTRPHVRTHMHARTDRTPRGFNILL